MSDSDWTALLITLKLAGLTTIILLVIATPLAWWLSRTQRKWKIVLEALVAMPLVLPPTVLGFYLLIMLGPNGWVGGTLEDLGGRHLAFSFAGLLIGSVIYSLPFAVQPLQTAFTAIGQRPLEVAATLRASVLETFFTIVLPLAKRGVLTALVLTFAHTLGEFGVVLMIGGNIPGETQVASIALYDHVEAMDYSGAHLLAAILMLSSFSVLLGVYALNKSPTRLLN